MSDIKNLWPKDLGKSEITMPKEVLLEQARFLSKQTKNVVIGEIKTDQGVLHGTDQKVMVHRFQIKAPSMGNYEFSLLRVMHNFAVYPIAIWNGLTEEKVTADSEDEFMQYLSQIFSSSEVRNAIGSMVAQSE